MTKNKPTICMFRLEYTSVLYDSRVLREAKALVQHNNEVTIIDVLGNNCKEREIIEGIQIERIKLWSKNFPSNLLGRLFKYIEFFIKAIIKGISKKAHVYHAHDLPVLFAALVSAKVNRAKLIYDSHELYVEMGTVPNKLKWLITKIEKLLCGFVDQIIVANESRAKVMQARYNLTNLPQPIMNCPSIVDYSPDPSSNNDFAVFLQEHGAQNKKIVLYQGGLMVERGLEQLVESAGLFDDNIVLVIIGEGRLKKKLQDMVVAAHLEAKVLFHPYVPYEQLLLYTKQAALGVVIYQNTCLNNYYCAPNKLFEYASANLPVVASNFPELEKIVKKYNIGELFDPNDPADIARAINAVFVVPARYEKIKQNTGLVKDLFNWEREEKKLLAIYNKL